MIVATSSNYAKNATITVSPSSIASGVQAVKVADFSSCYHFNLTGQAIINFRLPSPIDIDYFAIGGSNIGNADRVTISSGLVSVTEDIAADQSVAVVGFIARQVTNISLTIVGRGSFYISHIAFGSIYEFEHGMQSGYLKPWSVPNVQARNQSNLSGAPISHTYESRPIKATLSMPMVKNWQYDDLYRFIDFAMSEGVFYMKEDDDINKSYCCFNPKFTELGAHSQSPSLGVMSLYFDAHAKIGVVQ